MKNDNKKNDDSFAVNVKEFFKDFVNIIRGNRRKTKIRCAQLLKYFSEVDKQTIYHPKSCIDALLLWIEFMKKSSFRFPGLKESDIRFPPVVSDAAVKQDVEVMLKALRKDVMLIYYGGYSYIRSWDDDIRNFGVYTSNVYVTYDNYILGLIRIYEALAPAQPEVKDEGKQREIEIENQCSKIAEAREALEQHFTAYRNAIGQMGNWSTLTIVLSLFKKD